MNGEYPKIALITGITGQDGSYLSEFLLEKNYQVHGIIRRSSIDSTSRLMNILKKYENKIFLHYGDLSELECIIRIVDKVKPVEIYNLACQSHVKISFELPTYTSDIAALGFLKLLEAVRICKLEKHTRIYQASSSEMFGENTDELKNENSSFLPCSPYGASKLYSHHLVRIYRDAYGMFIVSGILFNHESPRRNIHFVTRKISKAVANIKANKQTYISLGNLDSVRDWGHALDYVEAMWLMLQQDTPEEFVIATGEAITVRKFVEICFEYIGFKIKWSGVGIDEVGIDQDNIVRVKVAKEFFREKEVDFLRGDNSKAREKLKWQPKYNIISLAHEMVEFDIQNPNCQF